LSIFLHLARQLNGNTKLDAVAFWQPLFSDVSASRAVGNLALTVAISGEVDLKVGASIEDNARPPAGVKRTDWSTFTGLGVSF
jgi:putative salt-induced outer membrane protein YdiY